jgi:hypothetical protein
VTSKRAELRHLLREIDNDEQLRLRGVQHAILRAESWYWVMRAEQFDQARPRPGDYPGGPVDWETGRPLNPPMTAEMLAEADRRCCAARDACLAKAELLDLEAEEVGAGDID